VDVEHVSGRDVGRTEHTEFTRGADGSERLAVSVRRRNDYDIVLRAGLAAQAGEVLGPLAARLGCPGACIVTDDVVAALHLPSVEAALAVAGVPVTSVVLSGGEANKDLHTLSELWAQFQMRGVRRRTLVVALGGGVVSDVAGFAAATYMRGLPHAVMPTTLLCQADAGIGGKIGIDHLGTKNLLGGFHQPRVVLVDPTLLVTLPVQQLREGYAEVVKVAMLGHPNYYGALRAAGPALLDPVHQDMTAIVRAAIARKIELLTADPYETVSLDRALNLGHCFGHAVESASEYSLGHGSCVAIGMALAAALGVERGTTSPERACDLVGLLDLLGLPVRLDPALVGPTWWALEHIRAVRNGPLRPVIPVAPGQWVIGDDVTRGEWEALARRCVIDEYTSTAW
jgi:3-dehydroquinate synthase